MTNDRYLFRGFHKDENGIEKIYLNGEEIKGEWMYGNLAVEHNKSYIFDTTNGYLESVKEVSPETIGQWSGLTNECNQKIFEHDILREYSNDIADWKVSYEYGKFVGTYDNCDEDLYELSDLDVIGTIFDEKGSNKQ